jgi:hypothetical protein
VEPGAAGTRIPSYRHLAENRDMSGYTRKDFSDDADFEFTGDDEPIEVLPEIGRREAQRGGPGTAARRTLEALAESRRLSRELAELDSYDDQ